MKKFPLKLEDLTPKEVKFKLSVTGDQEFTLCRWSLRVRDGILRKYTSAELKNILEKTMISELADIAYFMVKEKAWFEEKGKAEGMSGFDTFLDSISSVQDHITITKSVVGTIGIGEPEIQAITESIQAPKETKEETQDPNDQSPNLNPET